MSKTRRLLFTALLLLVVTLASHGKTLNMFYWVDDWAMAYKVLWPEEAPGNMGPGVFGTGPYRYLVTPFILLYPLFGFSSATPYFAIGLALYFFASVTVYLLVKELIGKHSLALGAATIFASGYIGAHALYRLTNSYQTAGGALFITLTAWLVAKYYRTLRKSFYWLALLLYTLTIEIFFIRAHGIIFVVLAIALFFNSSAIAKKSLPGFILKQIPFVAIYYFMYFMDPRILIQSGLVLGGIEPVVKEAHWELLTNFLITLGNALVPDSITAWIYTQSSFAYSKLLNLKVFPLTVLLISFLVPVIIHFLRRRARASLLAGGLLFLAFLFIRWSGTQSSSLWNPRGVELFAAMLVAGFLVLTFWVTCIFRKAPAVRLIPFSIFWFITSVATLFIYSPETSLESTSRYFVPGFVGIGMFYSALFFVTMRKFFFLPIAVLSLVLISFSNKEAETLLANVSTPDKQGYRLLQSEVTSVDENSMFYVEAADDPRFKGNVLGRLPQLGISTLFGYHGITTVADSYDHLLSLLSSKPSRLEQTHTFFFGANGYSSTTKRFRELLTKGQAPAPITDWEVNVGGEQKDDISSQTMVSTTVSGEGIGANPVLYADLDYDSIIPSVVEMTLIANPLSVGELKFPYSDVTSKLPESVSEDLLKLTSPFPQSIPQEQVITALRAEDTIQEFRKTAKVKATSSWKTTEEVYLIDGREDTNWGAHNIQWNDGIKPQEVVIDLGGDREVTRLVRINHHYLATPTKYTISRSLDGGNWIKVLEVEGGGRREGGEIIRDEFSSPINTRYIRMSIYDTYGGRGYPPAIKELWVSNLQDKVDSALREKVVKCPFCYIPDADTASEAIALTKSIAQARLWWQTDRYPGFYLPYSKEFRLILDGKPHVYKIFLPAHGSRFEKLKIDGFQVPVEISLDKVSIKSLALQEIQKEGLIRTLAE